LAIEDQIRNLGFDWTFLRPNSLQQTIGSFFGPSIRAGRGIIAPFGNCRVSYVNAEDVAAVAAEVLSRDQYKGRVINITGPDSLDHHKIAEIISNITGQPVKYQDISSDKFRTMLSKYGISNFFIDIMIELFEKAYKPGKVQALTNEVKSITGKRPIPFEQYVKDNIYDFLPPIPRVLVYDAAGKQQQDNHARNSNFFSSSSLQQRESIITITNNSIFKAILVSG
jgi:nucleoside-diphosphate-sugar epimerase